MSLCSTTSWSALPALGAGLGFRATFRGDLFLQQDAADFLEITSEHYLDPSPEKQKELDLLDAHYTLIPHCLNLSLGSAEGIDMAYVEQIAALIERIDPPWWSEHISFTRAGGIDIGHLTPLPFHREAIDVLCRNIERVKTVIKRPLILENITYPMAIPGAEMSELDFLCELLANADVGLLLDVTNLYTNATNHQYDAIEFIEQLPANRIVQLHHVGGMWQGDILLDTHSQPTPEEVWELMDAVMARLPIKGTILERDENIPPFDELAKELQRARDIGIKHARWGHP